MLEHWKNKDFQVIKEENMPTVIKDMDGVRNVEELLVEKVACISFRNTGFACFDKLNGYVVLDFGKEICGGLRFVVRDAGPNSRFRITFGESLTEACSSIGGKNATNDHSPRDFEVLLSSMSDLTFGQTGFRFARIELVSGGPVLLRNVFAINTLPYFKQEGYIKTNDEELNRIIETAIYTLKLNFQNGYIWDGIKRDRLVWSGDLNQEIISSIYLFGDNRYITNSLSFLNDETPATEWINTIPTYSAWWIINLCDYCKRTGNMAYFEANKDYAREVFSNFNKCINDDGVIDFKLPSSAMSFYLDWPTSGTADAVIGTASIIIYAAKCFLKMEEHSECHEIIRKLKGWLDKECEYKQTRAFQILAGRNPNREDIFLEKGGAGGFSTFMSYYILKADALSNGNKMIDIIKEYFGAMLLRGATTFWEDFHMDWLEGSGRIDEFPKEEQKDIHGDYGSFCYRGFRHSLCHGWSSGILAFLVECVLGIDLSNGPENVEIHPNSMGLSYIEAKLPFKEGWLYVLVENEAVEVKIIKE